MDVLKYKHFLKYSEHHVINFQNFNSVEVFIYCRSQDCNKCILRGECKIISQNTNYKKTYLTKDDMGFFKIKTLGVFYMTREKFIKEFIEVHGFELYKHNKEGFLICHFVECNNCKMHKKCDILEKKSQLDLMLKTKDIEVIKKQYPEYFI